MAVMAAESHEQLFIVTYYRIMHNYKKIAVKGGSNE